MTDSKENWTDSCERSTEYYMDINDSTAFGRGSDVGIVMEAGPVSGKEETNTRNVEVCGTAKNSIKE